MQVTLNLIPGNIEIGKLLYGTVVTGVASNPNSVYIKVDKYKLGEGLDFHINKSCMSVLLNVKTGALRAIPGNTRVIVLDSELNASTASNPAAYFKEQYLKSF